jgi:transposase-like protein
MADEIAEVGWDVLFTDPGSVGQMSCPVCSAPMTVERNQNVSASSSEAMTGKKRRRDLWRCSYFGSDWHNQLKQLRQEMDNTASPTLRGILQNDIDQILRSKRGAS